MARKKKNQLPSGSIRVQRVIGKDENGKRIVKSFTAPTKSEANRIADQYVETHKKVGEFITLSDAVSRYIALRKVTLSPTTIKYYLSYYKNLMEDFPSIMGKPLHEVVSDDIQGVIDGMLTDEYSGKTVRNRVGLIVAALEHYGIRIKGYQFPAKTRPELYVPSDEEVKVLINAAKGTEMEVPILLAAFGPMRCGEILGLREDAIKGNVVHVFRTSYYGEAGTGESTKDMPKNISSNRFIQFPDFVMDAIRTQGLPNLTHRQVDQKFSKLLRDNGLKHFRFHDLRHWCISTLHAQGLPDAYIMQRTGHSSDLTLKNVYRHTLADQSVFYTEKALSHFDAIFV